MSTQVADPERKLKGIASGDMGVMDALARMYEGNYEASGLDEQTYQLVRIAGLTALGASPASWLANLGAARELGIPEERVLGTLVALAPLVGSARIVAAGGNILRALGMAVAVAEAEEEGA